MSLLEAKNQILTQTPLATLIGEAVDLHKQAGKLVGCCPFHGENTPSFYVYHDHFHCFGCGIHGDAITFVRKKHGLGYLASLRWLADKYSINAGALERSADDLSRLKTQAQQGKILLAAQQFFAVQLQQQVSAEAGDYLKERGFPAETWAGFGFGYAPNNEAALQNHLKRLGFHREDLEQASLVTLYNERSYDFFRHRLTIPIHDSYGRLLAFGGRTLGGSSQKYKNSRYNKSAVLFAMHRARQSMAQKNRGLVVEGYFDALQLHQHGFTETVACQGTALTGEHLNQLNAATRELYLVFDGDSPGRQAALKIVTLALTFPQLRFKVVDLPTGEDPDSLIRQSAGKEMLDQLLAHAVDLISYAIRSKLAGAASTAVPHLIQEEFIPWLTSIPQPITRSFLCRQIAELSGVAEHMINQELNQQSKLRNQRGPRLPNSLAAPMPTRTQGATTALLAPPHDPLPLLLPPLVYELIGHLYFAEASELDLEIVRDFIERELQLEEVWLYFIEELLSCLASGQLPAIQDLGSWQSSQNNHVLRLMTGLRKTNAAFTCSDRKHQLKRLQLRYQQNRVRENIDFLKKQLLIPEASPESQRENTRRLLVEIALLNKKLYNIESLMQNS